MEIDGHPTQDIIEELERRGAVRISGSVAGPEPESLRFIAESRGDSDGMWLFLPRMAFLTDIDEPLP